MNKKRIERLWLWFFPRRCVWCTGVTESEHMLCAECAPKAEPKRLTSGRLQELPLVCVFDYHSQASKIMLGIKFHGGHKNAHSVGYAMADALAQAGFADKPLLFCCVPMTDQQAKARGFNQSELLAKAAARWLGAAYAPLLQKNRQTETQHDLPAAERDENVKQAYSAALPDKIEGQHIVLCDDICTTGATLRVCAAALQQAGAASVTCLAFLHTMLSAKH